MEYWLHSASQNPQGETVGSLLLICFRGKYRNSRALGFRIVQRMAIKNSVPVSSHMGPSFYPNIGLNCILFLTRCIFLFLLAVLHITHVKISFQIRAKSETAGLSDCSTRAKNTVTCYQFARGTLWASLCLLPNC